VGAIEGLHGAVLMTRAAEPVLDEADGWADRAAGRACTSHTRFQIASISKQFTAVAALLLGEAGALSVHDPLAKWLPQLPTEWQPITVHQLLCHTSGIRHWDNERPGGAPAASMPMDERLRLLPETPLLAAPGQTWRYSSPAFLFLARVIELAAERPYGELITERILAPLGMVETTFRTAPSAEAALGYSGDELVPLWDLGSMAGTGDLWSTTGDLSRFIHALHNGELLSAQSYEAMCTAHADVAGRESGFVQADRFGYGMFLGTTGSHRALFHTGDNPGFLSIAAWLPDDDAALVVLLNDEKGSIDGVVEQAVARLS
jgi:CubicO group peptidase (beta-lactamase class C family)